MDRLQGVLGEYLQCELCHALGAYRVAEERLEALADGLSDHATRSSDSEPSHLWEIVEFARAQNCDLGRFRDVSSPSSRGDPSAKRHGQDWPARERVPRNLPLTRPERFEAAANDRTVVGARADPWKKGQENWQPVPQFYSEAIYALGAYDRDVRFDEAPDSSRQAHRFAQSLLAPRDGTRGDLGARQWRKRRDQRIARFRYRCQHAHEYLAPTDHPGAWRGLLGRRRHLGTRDQQDRYEHDPDFLARIVTDSLASGEDSLALYVVRAQADAHLSMHAVEAWKTMCLGEQAQSLGGQERQWLDVELERSIVLSTFAYSVSRTAPWIFAENETERDAIFETFAPSWENLVPPRCMWIAEQISLLALHRRAYARALQGEPIGAYDDYHKLQRLIREADRRVRAAPIHVDGALEFLACLDAESHHHIGELYRSEHAHRPALEHFEAASHRLELLRKQNVASVSAVLTNSRWFVQLQISRGKASYELGRQTEALFWYLHAWRSFLELLAADTQTETNAEHINRAIDWLERIKFEPELRKSEVVRRLRPVIDQLDRLAVIPQLGVLAAEILLRLGHLLFILNVGMNRPRENDEPIDLLDNGASHGAAPSASRSARLAAERVKRTLAFACLAKAAECDPHSTLVGADLLKARFRFRSQLPGDLGEHYKEQLRLPELKPVHEHWPRGGDDYERLARVAEYLTLKSRVARYEQSPVDEPDAQTADADVARDLLLSLFMSTDSINVRKSQIHRFLMKSTPDAAVPSQQDAPAIEMICMRRYSSPFPLLPRPSAFRALGGGYFVRLHGVGADAGSPQPLDEEPPRCCAYGIVVDPGVDFVENLYRTGYGLGDVNMIILTHDHVDHIGALDPLLSLLHVRSELRSKQQDEAAERPAKVKVLTSDSVRLRYENVVRLSGEKSEFEFVCLEEMAQAGPLRRSDPLLDDFPAQFEILAISSAAGQGEGGGHLDLSGKPSLGICIRVVGGDGPSLALTSDTPPPPPPGSASYARWRDAWSPALDADVLVAHLGSVPLTELRRMDPIEQARGAQAYAAASDPVTAALESDEQRLLAICAELEASDESLQGQVEYAQWLRSHAPKDGPEAPIAELVGPVPEHWLPPPEHNYLSGLLAWARAYMDAQPRGLFVVGELSEELGTMRSKVAARLNEHVFGVREQRSALEQEVSGDGGTDAGGVNKFAYALTADLGLHVCVSCTPPETGEATTRTEVLCTICDLDTDRVPSERFHTAHDVYEVCVKGENEGIFYNCLEHDPARREDPAFLEKLERFDIFGR